MIQQLRPLSSWIRNDVLPYLIAETTIIVCFRTGALPVTFLSYRPNGNTAKVWSSDDIFSFDTRIIQKTEAYYVKGNYKIRVNARFQASVAVQLRRSLFGMLGSVGSWVQIRIMVPSSRAKKLLDP